MPPPDESLDAGGCEGRLRAALAAGAREPVVRLEERQVDAAALTFLRDVAVALDECGGRLTVIVEDPFVHRLLELMLPAGSASLEHPDSPPPRLPHGASADSGSRSGAASAARSERHTSRTGPRIRQPA